MKKPDDILTIKKIKDVLIAGTNMKRFQHGEFAKLLLVDGSGLFDSEYFENSVFKNDSAFNLFVNGNLRRNSTKWSYAIKNVSERLEAINKQTDSDVVYESLLSAFQLHIIPMIIQHDDSGEDLCIEGIYKGLLDLVNQKNTYYVELYDHIIDKLQKRNDLNEVLSLMIMVAVFQDNIHLLFPDKYITKWSDDGFFPHSPNIQSIKERVYKEIDIPYNTNDMFNTALTGKSSLGRITKIDMAFHRGAHWQRDSEKVEFLKKAIEAKVKIRIIVNSDLIKEICSHMTQPGKRYVGFDESALEWIELSQKYPDLLEVHIAKVPLLHRTYIIRNGNEQGWVNIKYYTYGNYISRKNHRICLDNTERSYDLYLEEFEYLWNNASFQYTGTASVMDLPSRILSKMASEENFSSSDKLGDSLLSQTNESDKYRDVYKSSKLFDPDKSLESLLEKAKHNDEMAMTCAGIYYFYGISNGKDLRKSAEWFKKVSNLNGKYAPIADKFIARMYYSGCMPREEQSYEKSYEYHVKSAAGDLYSAGQVGFMQSIGSGCKFDYKKTEEYFLQIFDRLDNPRKDTLCRFYLSHGEFKKAADIYVQMAESYPEAAYQLGLLYKRGVLSEPFMPDYSKASFYLQMALDSGYIKAAYELGTLFFNPTGNFKKDFEKAHKYYHIAAEKGDPEAQYMLGFMYYYGHVEKNIHKSLKYHGLAAAQGHVLSAATLGYMYQIPEIHNYEKAFYFAKYAADRGDAPSEFVLGTLYLSGRGCEPNEDKAYLCFKHAAENGAPEAELLLMQMNEMGI